MASALPGQAFWADDAPGVLSALYSAEEAQIVLELWKQYRLTAIHKAQAEAETAGRDGSLAISQAEERLQAEFARKMAAAQARVPENSPTCPPVFSIVDGSPGETSAVTLSQDGAKLVNEYKLDTDQDIRAQAIRAYRQLFPEFESAVDPTYTEMRRALTSRIEALLEARMISQLSYKTYLSRMPHPTRDDGLNSRQLLQWEWAFNRVIAIWLATQMSDADTDEEEMEDGQQVSSSDGTESSVAHSGSSSERTEPIDIDPVDLSGTVIPDSQEQAAVIPTQVSSGSEVSKVPVDSCDASPILSGPQAPVPEVIPQNSSQDSPSVPDGATSAAPQVAAPAMETQDDSDDVGSLPPGQRTPATSGQSSSPPNQSPLTLNEVLARGLIADPTWMKTRTVVMRVQRQKFFVTVTRDQIMTDLQVMGISREMLIGIGESGSGEWEIYCLHEHTALHLSEQKAYQYAGKFRTELFLLGRQTSVIRVHWLPLRVNNTELEDWVHNFSDEIKDISYETSVATQAEGLLTGIRRIRCILRDGVDRTDIPYKESIMAEDGSLYTVLVSVEGRLPKCLKCEKLGHIRRDCKAKKCFGCYHMTDEHVTATCPYKHQYSTKASNPQAPSVPQTKSVRLQHPPGVSRPQGPSGPHITRYQAAGREALGVTEKQLVTDLAEDPFTEVLSKKNRRHRRRSSNGSQGNTPVLSPVEPSTSLVRPPQVPTPTEEPFPDLTPGAGVASSGKTPYVQQVHVPQGTAFTLEDITGKSDKADPPQEETSPKKKSESSKTPDTPKSPPPKKPPPPKPKGHAPSKEGKVTGSRAQSGPGQASTPKPQRGASARSTRARNAEVEKTLKPASSIPPAPKPSTNPNPKRAATTSSSSGSHGTQSRDPKKLKSK